MIGSEIVRAREKLGWTRAQLAEKSGLPYTRVATLERYSPVSGGRGFQAGEEAALRAALNGALGASEASSLPAGDDWEQEVVRLVEWEGLREGDVVRLEGDRRSRAEYRFGFYFRSPAQEYVQLYSTRNGNGRSVRPEVVLRKVKGVWKRVLA